MSPAAFKSNWPRRVAWFLALWSASVAALGVVAGLFRVVMNLAGLTV